MSHLGNPDAASAYANFPPHSSYCKQPDIQINDILLLAQLHDEHLCCEVSDGSCFSTNAIRFPATENGVAMAHQYAEELFDRWLAVKEYRIASRVVSPHDSLRK